MSFETKYNKQPLGAANFIRITSVAVAVAALVFTANKMSGPDMDGCDSQLLNPGSWIECTIIDGGQAVTRTVSNAFTAEINRGIP